MTYDPRLHAAQILLIDIKDHRMEILRSDGLYRDLLFQRPDSGLCSIRITTAPGMLTTGGDMPSYTFRGTGDMFEYFRPASEWEINPEYWTQKLRSHDKDQVTGFHKELADAEIARIIDEYAASGRATSGELYDVLSPEELRAEVRDLDESGELDTAQEVVDLVQRWYRQGVGTASAAARIRERIIDWDHHYLRALWAIVWAVSQVDGFALTIPDGIDWPAPTVPVAVPVLAAEAS